MYQKIIAGLYILCKAVYGHNGTMLLSAKQMPNMLMFQVHQVSVGHKPKNWTNCNFDLVIELDAVVTDPKSKYNSFIQRGTCLKFNNNPCNSC